MAAIPFCDLKIAMPTTFLTSWFASFSKSFVNAELEIQTAPERLLPKPLNSGHVNYLCSQEVERASTALLHFAGPS